MIETLLQNYVKGIPKTGRDLKHRRIRRKDTLIEEVDKVGNGKICAGPC